MLLDSEVAEQLYVAYQRGDDEALEQFLEEVSPLIEVIALSVSPHNCEDLAQEARLKVMSIVMDDKFDSSRGCMYNFLSSALKFHMIDCMRKGGKEDLEEDCDGYVDDDPPTMFEFTLVEEGDIIEYSICRYPSVHDSVAYDATDYVLSALPEHTQEGSRGVIRTICVVYELNRQLARTMYFGTMAVAKMEALGLDWEENIDGALEVAECAETTLLPEIVLMFGTTMAGTMQNVFSGSYVKF